jgi:putative ABC transport system ATP-binding protein
VSIARSLVMRPTLILADEPTGALDSRSSVEVMGIFQRLNAELGITVVFVTHEPDIAEYTQRIIRIRDGFLGADERVEQQRDAAAELERRTIVPFPTTLTRAGG